MTLSAWKDFEKIQTATCDHAGTTTVTDNLMSCSACNSSWPSDTQPPKTTMYRQVQI